MELVYCDRCGFRVSEQDLAGGRAVRIDEKVFCPKCAPPPLPNVGNVGSASKKVGSRLIPAVEVPKRNSPSMGTGHTSAGTSSHDSKRVVMHGTHGSHGAHPPSGAHPQQKKPANMALPIAAGVGACALLIGLVAMSGGGGGGGTKEKSVSSHETYSDTGTRTQSSTTSSTASTNTRPQNPVYEQPSQTPSPMLAPLSKNDPETIASDAFEKVRTFDGLAAGDVDGRVKRLDDFIAKYGDSIAAARARRVRDELKAATPAEATPSQPAPPPPPPPTEAAQTVPPPPPPTPPAPTPVAKPGGTEAALFSENFEAAVEGLAFGEVVDAPAPGTGKVLALRGKTDWAKAALVKWAKRSGEQRKFDFPIPEAMHVRFRYYIGNAKDFRFVIAVAGEPRAYEHPLDAVVKNTWTSVDVPISECAQVDTGEKIKPGAVFDEIRFNTWGNGEIVAYVDDIWLGVPGAAATPVPAGTGTSVRTDTPKAVVQPGKIAGYEDFLYEYYAVLRRYDRASAEALLNAASFPGKESELAQDGKALAWLTDLEAALPKGVEKLKDVDSFELKPEKASAMNVGKKGKFHIDEFKDGVFQVASDAARVPVALEALETESRDQLTLLGLDTDGKGALLRAFIAVKKLDGKAAAYQLAGARALLDKAKAAGAPPELASLKRELDVLLAKAQDIEKAEAAVTRLELTASHEWIVITQAFEAGRYDQIKPALDAFKEKFGSTAFAAKKTDEIKMLQTRSIEIPLAKGLAGYWKLDEGKGTITADASGNLNTGKIMGAEWGPAHVGTGLSFNGADDFVEFADKPGLRITEALTVSIWFKNLGKTRNWGRVVSKGWSKFESPWICYGLLMNDGDDGQQKMKFQTSLSGEKFSEVLTQRVFPVDGTWHHVVGVFDGPKGRIAIYVDGSKEGDIATNNATIASTPTALRLADDPTSKEKHKCALDEVRIYNRALSEAEVKALFGLYK